MNYTENITLDSLPNGSHKVGNDHENSSVDHELTGECIDTVGKHFGPVYLILYNLITVLKNLYFYSIWISGSKHK